MMRNRFLMDVIRKDFQYLLFPLDFLYYKFMLLKIFSKNLQWKIHKSEARQNFLISSHCFNFVFSVSLLFSFFLSVSIFFLFLYFTTFPIFFLIISSDSFGGGDISHSPLPTQIAQVTRQRRASGLKELGSGGLSLDLKLLQWGEPLL